MDTSFDNLTLTCAHERKVLEAVDALIQARDLVLAAAGTDDSSQALRRQAAQARRRSRELLNDAARLTATAERLLAEARSIHREQSAQ